MQQPAFCFMPIGMEPFVDNDASLLGKLLTLTTMAAYVASALHSSPKLQPTNGSPSSLYIDEVLYLGTR